MVDARDRERHLLCHVRRHRVASSAQRPASEEHGLRPPPVRGAAAACSPASTTTSSCWIASRPDGKPRRVPRRWPVIFPQTQDEGVNTTESGGPRSCDARKTVKGRKRQALVDTDGRPRPGARSAAGRCPGPRRTCAGAQAISPLLSVYRQGLGRRVLCRRQAGERRLHRR